MSHRCAGLGALAMAVGCRAAEPRVPAPPAAPTATVQWETVSPGVERARVPLAPPGDTGSGVLTALRLDLAAVELVVLVGDERRPTAEERLIENDLVAAINAGMFADDWHTHEGRLTVGDRSLGRDRDDYQSVSVWGPRRPGLPPFQLVDLDETPPRGPALDALEADYTVVNQNLRLIKAPRDNRWARSTETRSWSEAALAIDSAGRPLLLFSATPFVQRDWNDRVLSIPELDVVAAQHLDGGPPAQLSYRDGAAVVTLHGTHETGMSDNARAGPLPFVLGVAPRR